MSGMEIFLPGLVTAGWNAVVAGFSKLVSFFREKPDEYNDTMRAIHERTRLQELEDDRLRREADQCAREREELARQRDADAKRREDEARVEAEKAKEDLKKGIRPVVWPTREEFLAAKERVQYDPEKFHFAVCGASGSGKSSLVNAFRGLKPTDEAAAKVDVTECTSVVTRYPDPRKEYPYSRFVWYDIPGAGTINVPDWQYFNDQGLFVFDFIIIVYGDRFTEIDKGIIMNCLRFKIPFFVVRSKADQHIRNMMDDTGEEERQVIVDKYVETTRANFEANLEKMAEDLQHDEGSRQLLLEHPVYIVSKGTLLKVFQMKTNEGARPSLNQSNIIGEDSLIEDMLRKAIKRRYPAVASKLASIARFTENLLNSSAQIKTHMGFS